MACWSGAWGSLGEDTGLDGFRDTGESCLHCVCTIRTLFVRTLFVGNQYILASIIRHLIKAVLLSATLAIVALPGLARAQSGSAGGSIGNDEKSLSGSRETPRAAEPSKPARRSKTETEAPSRAPRKSGGGNAAAISTERGFSRASARPAAAPPIRWLSPAAGWWGNTAPLKSVRTAASLVSDPREA